MVWSILKRRLQLTFSSQISEQIDWKPESESWNNLPVRSLRCNSNSMTVSLKLESRVAPESKLTYRVLKYTSSKISDLISRKTLVGESKKLFALRCIWDEKSMKAMIGTNSKQLSGCLVFTRLHSQLLPNSKIIFQIMPNCQDLLIFLPFSLFLKSV